MHRKMIVIAMLLTSVAVCGCGKAKAKKSDLPTQTTNPPAATTPEPVVITDTTTQTPAPDTSKEAPPSTSSGERALVNLGFMTCSSGSLILRKCKSNDQILAPVQDQFSSFIVTYSFPCLANSLMLALQTDKVHDVMLLNFLDTAADAPTRTVTLYGRGPLQIAAIDPKRLLSASVSPNCKLNIQTIKIDPVVLP